MFPVLQIGSLAIRLPGLLVLLGLWLATFLIDRQAPRRGVPGTDVNSMILYALLGGVLGARLGHALRYLDIYLENPLALISLNPATLSMLEGVAAAGIVAVVYGHRKRLPLWPTLDTLTPGLALTTVFVGLAHLSSGDAFGAETQLPWAIELWGAYRHPTQVYEILSAVMILGLVLWLQSRVSLTGLVFLIWLSLTAAARLLVEGFRGDSVIVLGGLRSAQLVSLAVLLAGMTTMHLLAKRGSTLPDSQP